MASQNVDDKKLLVNEDEDSLNKSETISPDNSLNETENTTLLELSEIVHENEAAQDDDVFHHVELKPLSDESTAEINNKEKNIIINVISQDSTENIPLINDSNELQPDHATNEIESKQNSEETKNDNVDQKENEINKSVCWSDMSNEAPTKSSRERPTKKLKLVEARLHQNQSLLQNNQSLLQSPGDCGTPRSGKPKAINVAVFLKEGTGRLLMLEKGRLTTAGEIKKMMMENLALPAEGKDVFALWLVSPLLEIQLKDNHVPFKLRKQWPEMLDKFTTASKHEISKDEPVLVFQRNSFFPIAEEKKITDERIIRRLFEEAKHNILSGRYPVTNADAEMLGGCLARVDHGKFDTETHRIGFFKNNLTNYLPQSACKGKLFSMPSLLMRTISSEQKLLTQYERASERADDPKKFHKLFLEFCWALPFYGCAFFKGQVEQQSRDYIWRSGDMNVHIGIGREGMTIFKENRKEILMSLGFDDLSWDCVPSTDPNIPDSFCIEFDTTSDDGRHLAQQLQILSPQAVMMDAMIDSCVAEMNRLKIPKSPLSPVFMEEGKPLADPGPPNIKRDRKAHFSLSNPFKLGK